MHYPALQELVKKTRSVRRFKAGVSIAQEELIDLIDTVRLVSSARNMQPLRYVVVNEASTVRAITEEVTWAAHLEDWSQAPEQAPAAYIIMIHDTDVGGHPEFDAGIALQTIALLLQAKGYAACPLASIDREACSKRFSLAEHQKPLLGIAIGVADENVLSVEANDPAQTAYYRDACDAHCVPKHKLDTVLLGTF